MNKTAFGKTMTMSRSMLYYHHKMPDKDWQLKQQIELVLRDKKSYGHKRIADHLDINRKRVLRVMKLFGIKPYRRRGRKWKKPGKDYSKEYPNLLLTESPCYPNHIWASDFTYIPYKKRTLYLATIIDLFTREVVGFSILLCHSNSLVMNALLSAVSKYPAPAILHSDQESFYSQFKVDLGDPNRFNHLGELVWAIYKTIHDYNNDRIHTKLKMPPAKFAQRHQERSEILVE